MTAKGIYQLHAARARNLIEAIVDLGREESVRSGCRCDDLPFRCSLCRAHEDSRVAVEALRGELDFELAGAVAEIPFQRAQEAVLQSFWRLVANGLATAEEKSAAAALARR